MVKAKDPRKRIDPRQKSNHMRAPDPAGTGGDGRALRPNDNAPDQAELLRHHYKQWAEAREKVKDIERAAKDDGISRKMLTIAETLHTNPDRVANEVADRIRVSRWFGKPLGWQAEMFDAETGHDPQRSPGRAI